MKVFAVLSFFALVEGSCYDYEYYDPDTGASVPGNACARQAAAAAGGATTVGQPAAVASTTFGAATTFATPAFTTTSAPYSSTFAAPVVAPIAPATAFSTVAASYPVASVSTAYAPAPIATTIVTPPAAVYTSVAAAPVYGVTTAPVSTVVRAPAVTVRAPAVATQARSGSSGSSLSQSEIEYYKNLGERQAQQHRRNTRIVEQSAQDLSRLSLVNRVVAGPGKAASFFPILRLNEQKDVAEAYRSEKRIANKNAEDAYQRFQQDPSRLNLLVSKYQDLNADLRDSAYQYNVVNSGTFGQRIASNSLFGSFGGGLFGGLTQIITQRQQSDDLQDIQRQMLRVQRQIQAEVQTQQRGSSASAGLASGSVQQRLVAMSTYGPQRG